MKDIRADSLLNLVGSTTEGAHGLLQSNKDCVTGKLQDFGYPDEAIEALLTAANSGPGARHPLRQGDEVSAERWKEKNILHFFYVQINRIGPVTS